MIRRPIARPVWQAALRLCGVVAVLLALAMPHVGMASASVGHVMDMAQMHSDMGDDAAAHKSMDPALCAMVCAGCVPPWQPTAANLKTSFTALFRQEMVVLAGPLAGPDPALRPPKPSLSV